MKKERSERHDQPSPAAPRRHRLPRRLLRPAGGLDRAAPKGVAVRTASVEQRDLPDEIVLTGTLKPRAQVQVVAEVPARLLRLQRDEGARVAKGEVLAVLDETDYRLANDRARAALAVADANRAHAQAERPAPTAC